MASAPLYTVSADGQGRAGHIGYVFPAGGQRGRTVEVTVGGKGLDGARGVWIAGEGVRWEVLEADSGTMATVAVAIAPDAEPGRRDLRLLTPAGASNIARFIVSDLPEILEAEANSKGSRVQLLSELPVVVNGQIELGGKDFYGFTALAGQTIVCRVQAQQLQPFLPDSVPGCCQAVLTLYDGSGRWLASVGDVRLHGDPVLVHTSKRRGKCVLEVRDALLRGREDFVYRLSIGELPYLTHIYPLGANCRSTGSVSLFGVNLPDDDIPIPPAPPCPGIQFVGPGQDGLACNRLPLARGSLAEVNELEPNDAIDRPEMLDAPVTVNGRIEDPADIDHYAFYAEAGERLVLEIAARRLESPLDSRMTLFSAEGEAMAENDDYRDDKSPQIVQQTDSRLIHTFQAAGKYVLRITDSQGNGGEEYAYRLSISPPRPDFELRVTPDNPSVYRGEATTLTVTALRKDGFDGPIDLSPEGLPDGLTSSGTTIPAGQTKVALPITAAADAALGIYTPTILGAATVDGQRATRRAMPMESLWRAFLFRHLLPTQELVLTVLERGR